MARSLWSGTLNFGLVSIPVRLMTAVRERSIHFNLLTPDGTCRLRQKLYCPETDKEYDFKDTARGFEIAPDQYVIVDDKEIDRLKPEAGRGIDLMQFVALDAVDPIYFNRAYYLVPDHSGAKAYQLLHAAMEHHKRAAVGRLIMRERAHIAAIRALQNVLVLHTLYYHDEIVPPDSLDDVVVESRVPAREMKMAEQLIGALDGRFKPEEFHDEFRQKLQKAIEAKAQGHEIVTAATEDRDAPPVYNLMEALRRSVAEAEGEHKQSRRSAAAPRKRRRSA